MDPVPPLPGPPPPAAPDPPPLLAVLISDAGTHETTSFYPRLRRWLKAALRGYGLRCQGVRREPEPQSTDAPYSPRPPDGQLCLPGQRADVPGSGSE